ncbi:MAG: CCA tRNA nucleotidyltransferase [Anaerolineaceae bacterium]|nr:MAG: CCA tRNA nucleotidyltransferase [Anaerolineaceae bacterium]
MSDMTPRPPRRPLVWPDAVYDLQEALSAFSAPVYIVGGAVRDAYMGRPVHDLDFATLGNPIKIARHIADAFDGDVYVMDAERGVARAMIDRPDGRYVVDVAAFRGLDLLADLTMRDFTFNAIAVHLQGDLTQIIDPLDGGTDLFDKVLRQCSDSTFRDDPLRVLRAIRQSVQFSARIEPRTLAGLRLSVESLPVVSAERLRDEFFKILSLPRASQALRVASRLGVLEAIVPELFPLRDVPSPTGGDMWDATLFALDKMQAILKTISPQRTDLTASVFDLGMMVMALDYFRPKLQAHITAMWPDDRSHAALLSFAALYYLTATPHTELDAVEMIGRRARALRLSADEIRRLRLLVGAYRQPLQTPVDDLSVHRFWHRYGEVGVDLCLLAMAAHLAEQGVELDQDEWIALLERLRVLLFAYYERYEEIVAPPPLLSGADLIEALALAPGKQIGQLLDVIREAQVTGEVSTRDAALALARGLID